MESSKKLIKTLFLLLEWTLNHPTTTHQHLLCWEPQRHCVLKKIITTTNLAAELEVYFCHCFLFRVPISLVTPMLCISPITSTAPAVSQLMTYGKTALSNFFFQIIYPKWHILFWLTDTGICLYFSMQNEIRGK